MSAVKFKLTKNTKTFCGRTFYQIKAVASFGLVVSGDLGGWVEKENNLSQNGNAWVSGYARVFGGAQVHGDARVFGDAQVYGDARVSGNARVSGDAQVFGDSWVYGYARVSGNAWVSGYARVFGGAQVHGDARVSGNASVLWVSNVGSENGTLTAAKTATGIFVSRGCFSGSLAEFEAAVAGTHAGSPIEIEYNTLISFIKARLGK